MQYFNIQVASQLSGVASATIRAWEKRYKAVVPERGDNKHRFYSEKDIEKLALLFKLTEIGQSIGKIAHLELKELKYIYATLMHRPYDEKQAPTPFNDRVDFNKILGNLQLALATYKIDIVSHELEKAISTVNPRDFCLQIIIPLFSEIGMKVERGEFSIAQEHTLSSIVKFHMGQMIGQHYQKKHLKEQLFLLTTPENELHDIGLLCSSLLLVQHGFKFIFLGPNMPAASLAEAACALRCDKIILGVSRFNLSENLDIEQYLHQLLSALPVKTEVWMGGELRNSGPLRMDNKKLIYLKNLLALDEMLKCL